VSNSALVVVDAWKDPNLENYPDLGEEMKIFGSYINFMCGHIRKTHAIIHNASGQTIMDEIDTSEDLVVSFTSEMPKFDMYYFCGFHVNRCIKEKMKELNYADCGLVLNMSLIFPADTWHGTGELDTYLYSRSHQFERVILQT